MLLKQPKDPYSASEYAITADVNGKRIVMYDPQPHQLPFHWSDAPNLLALGNRGGGKSACLRWDAHMRALAVPGCNLILLRKTYKDLIKSHLRYMKDELELLGGRYHETNHIAYYPNGSTMFLSHIGKDARGLEVLGAEYLGAYFDELSTIPWDIFTQLYASVRVDAEDGLQGVVRACSNPLGPSAAEMKKFFYDKDVTIEEDGDYDPGDWQCMEMMLRDNKFVDAAQYEKRLMSQPVHVRKAWLEGKFSLENALFDFQPEKEVEIEGVKKSIPYHVIPDFDLTKILKAGRVYRAYDHGYSPDPAYCLWIAHLGDRYIAFHEKEWKKTVVSDIAKEMRDITDSIARSCGMDSLRISGTYCDPTIDLKTGADIRTIKDIFEENGVPMTCSVNNRELFASSVHTALMEESSPNLPRLQIIGRRCPYLVKTLPVQQYDEKHTRALANHKHDHPTITLAYFLMSHSSEQDKDWSVKPLKRWQIPKKTPKYILGSENVRTKFPN